MSRNKLTPKQQLFVQEYLVDLNATKAAIRAGYSEKTAYRIGSTLVQKSSVQEALQTSLNKRNKRIEINQDYVVSSLQEVVERCMQHRPVLNMKGEQIQDEEGRNIWTFNANGANKALELLGKHLGMFVDRTELTGKGGAPLVAASINLSGFTTEELRRLAELKKC
jgi:phage terminase small subunit